MTITPNKLNNFLLIFMFTLAIPTGAILVSNNALPGDTFYPVKTTLEKTAAFIFSPSYQAKSDLQIKLIERRIEENQKLILSSGSTRGLSILVAQAESAKEYIINSNASKEVKSQAMRKLVSTLRTSQRALEEKKNEISLIQSSQTKTDTSNQTISQGNTVNHPTQTNSPDRSTHRPTTGSLPIDQEVFNEDIDDANQQLENIIDNVEENDTNTIPEDSQIDSNDSTPTPTIAPTPEPTPEITTTPEPTPTIEQIKQFLEKNKEEDKSEDGETKNEHD